jgi:hypothetical protein
MKLHRRDFLQLAARALPCCRVCLLLLLSGLSLPNATAHDWYERDCCGGRHCHAVADGVVSETGLGVEVRGFEEVLSYSDPRVRWSHDNRYHVCSSQDSLYCVYLRPKQM